eukprot:c52872_g1_i1.p1 GENE.c52872_g1_i1~~c52872_g1_i1.p1  ORF type:complete len:105 (+),score=18.48 c52872_g1_i1:52-366(+)
MVNYVETMAEYEALLANSPFVLVDFTAAWCGPCQKIAPVFERLAHENSHITFIKVDVDRAGDIAEKENVTAMPTFILFRQGGQVVGQMKGADAGALSKLIGQAK